jgi:hypothetical protein
MLNYVEWQIARTRAKNLCQMPVCGDRIHDQIPIHCPHPYPPWLILIGALGPFIDAKIRHSLNKRQPKLATKDLFTVGQAFNPGDLLVNRGLFTNWPFTQVVRDLFKLRLIFACKTGPIIYLQQEIQLTRKFAENISVQKGPTLAFENESISIFKTA